MIQMAYETPDKLANRYLSVAPMPRLVDSLKELADAVEAAEFTCKNIRDECCETLHYGDDYKERFKKGELDGWTDEDMARLDGECDMAYRILKAIGYEVDYWFCGWPKLKPVEVDDDGD